MPRGYTCGACVYDAHLLSSGAIIQYEWFVMRAVEMDECVWLQSNEVIQPLSPSKADGVSVLIQE